MFILVISGGNFIGMIMWLGDGIISINGMFDLVMVNIGDNLVIFFYE